MSADLPFAKFVLPTAPMVSHLIFVKLAAFNDAFYVCYKRDNIAHSEPFAS